MTRGVDESEFAELAEQYRRPLHLYLYRLVGSMEEAEDLLQETLLKARKARASFEGRSKFRTSLYTIATNTALNALQRAPRRVLPRDIAPAASGEPRSEPP